MSRLIDADEIKFESSEFETYNDYSLAFDAIDKAPTVDQWHYPSRGEVPEDGRCVWNGYIIVYYLPDLEKWYRFDDDELVRAPYAWCDLPVPPKEEE